MIEQGLSHVIFPTFGKPRSAILHFTVHKNKFCLTVSMLTDVNTKETAAQISRWIWMTSLSVDSEVQSYISQ